jgi:hypothetical protein
MSNKYKYSLFIISQKLSETQKVGLEPLYQGLGVVHHKTRKHEFTAWRRFICVMVLDSIYNPEPRK